MSAADISTIVVAVVSLASAVTALIRAEAARVQSQSTQKSLSEHVRINSGKPEA